MLAINRIVSNTLEKYHKERLSFAQTIAELAQRETYISSLQSHNVLPLLRPLLLDNIPAIQQAAALAIGRLANHSEEMAEAIVDSDILPHLICSLKNQNVNIDNSNISFHSIIIENENLFNIKYYLKMKNEKLIDDFF